MSEESSFLQQHSDGGIRIWSKQLEIMDPSCLVSWVQGDGVQFHGVCCDSEYCR